MDFRVLGFAPIKVLAAVLLLAPTLRGFGQSEPPWWSDGGTRIIAPAVAASNYSPVNVGQLKHVATQARLHLNATLPGGAGTAIDDLVASFGPANGTAFTAEELRKHYAPANLGQLKAVAKPFYDRLIAAGIDTRRNLIVHGYPVDWASAYPWNPGTAAAENYAPVLLGQLKVVFAFDAGALIVDGDSNGLPDQWEIEQFGASGQDPAADPDGDGVTNLAEYLAGTDPQDFFNGQPAVLSISGGNSQSGSPGVTLPVPLSVKITNHFGVPRVGVTVTFATESGGGSLAPQLGGATDAQGIAKANLTLPTIGGTQVAASASYAGQQALFTAGVTVSASGPAAPGTPVVDQQVGSTEATITWEDRSNDETAFYVERGGYGQPWVRVATLPANTVSFTDTGLVPDSINYYRVIAHNEAP